MPSDNQKPIRSLQIWHIKIGYFKAVQTLGELNLMAFAGFKWKVRPYEFHFFIQLLANRRGWLMALIKHE